ncbi:MAG: nitrilase-related carbon-nitrogen hydrolase [Planctomycetaceae bacterium]
MNSQRLKSEFHKSATKHWSTIAVVAFVITDVAVHNGRNIPMIAGPVLIISGITRQLLAVGTGILFTVSFPPYSWSTSWFCLAPMMWLWRDKALQISRRRLVVEAVTIGFSMAWLSTGFVRDTLPAFGSFVHAAACCVFSMQFVGVAIAIRVSQNQPIVVAAAVTALVAVAGEFVKASFGLSWSIANIALTVGATPLAQWSRWITAFGVAGLLYFVNFLMYLDHSKCFIRRWIGPALGVLVLSAAWIGGDLIEKNTTFTPLSFTALLVQPHLKVIDDKPWQPWLNLDQLTKAALLERHNVDLIVWPETCLTESWSHERDLLHDNELTQLTPWAFSRLCTPSYKTNCLVGAVMNERGTTQRYGLEVADVRRYNSGCLVSRSGNICRHDKLDLVPFKEGLPGVLDTAWIRKQILPGLQFNQPLAYGKSYAPLCFHDSVGKQHSIAVSICYESLLPWLPQYRESPTVEAIIHLVYDGNTADHPGVIQRQLLACQMRAIETRKWNLVCSTWMGTSIIDPTGKIVRQLPPVAGVLRTDM